MPRVFPPLFVALPLFVLMGEILFHSGAVDVLYRSLDRLIGPSRLRLYYMVIALSTIMGALSGSAMAVVAMLGRSMLPGMIVRGHDRRMSIGLILSGASLAPIIPPSITVILIGGLAGVSVSELLIAGIGPGLLLSFLFLLYLWVSVALKPSLAPPEEKAARTTAVEKLWALLSTLPFALVIAAAVGTILLGIATPEEAAAMGVIGSIGVAAIYRKFSFALLGKAALETAKITGMILAIIMCSKMFGQMLAFSGATTSIVQLMSNLDVSRWLILFQLFLLPFIWCMFLDPVALMLIVIPLYKPISEALGFDPVWFWTLFLINITVGGLTPPFGYAMFALKASSPDLQLKEIFASAWPFVGIFIIAVLMITVFPGIATYLPEAL